MDNVSKSEVESILDKIGAVDILMIPVGGKHKFDDLESHTLNAEEAVGVVGEIEPRIAIRCIIRSRNLPSNWTEPINFLKRWGRRRQSFYLNSASKRKTYRKARRKWWC